MHRSTSNHYLIFFQRRNAFYKHDDNDNDNDNYNNNNNKYQFIERLNSSTMISTESLQEIAENCCMVFLFQSYNTQITREREQIIAIITSKISYH